MTIATGLVLYCVVFAIVFYMVNPLWQVSQGEAGKVEPGTPESAPVDAMVGRKAMISALAALVIVLSAWIVLDRQLVTLEDLSWITPPSAR